MSIDTHDAQVVFRKCTIIKSKDLVMKVLQYPNVELEIDNVRIPSHAALWAVHSELFETSMMKGKNVWNLKTLGVPLDQKSQLLKFVECIHGTDVRVSLKDVVTFVEIADALLMHNVKIRLLYHLMYNDEPLYLGTHLARESIFQLYLHMRDSSYAWSEWTRFTHVVTTIYLVCQQSVQDGDARQFVETHKEMLTPLLFLHVQINRPEFDKTIVQSVTDLPTMEYVRTTFLRAGLLRKRDFLNLHHFLKDSWMWSLKGIETIVEFLQDAINLRKSMYAPMQDIILDNVLDWLHNVLVVESEEIYHTLREFADDILKDMVTRRRPQDVEDMETLALRFDLCNVLGYIPKGNYAEKDIAKYPHGYCMVPKESFTTDRGQIVYDMVEKCGNSGCNLNDTAINMIANYVTDDFVVDSIKKLVYRGFNKSAVMEIWTSIVAKKNPMTIVRELKRIRVLPADFELLTDASDPDALDKMQRYLSVQRLVNGFVLTIHAFGNSQGASQSGKQPAIQPARQPAMQPAIQSERQAGKQPVIQSARQPASQPAIQLELPEHIGFTINGEYHESQITEIAHDYMFFTAETYFFLANVDNVTIGRTKLKPYEYEIMFANPPKKRFGV